MTSSVVDQARRVLGPTQLAILGAEAAARERATFTVVSSVLVVGVPDCQQLVLAADTTLARHDALSWELDLDDEFRIQAAGGRLPRDRVYRIEVHDLRERGAAQARAEVEARVDQERWRSIDVLDPAFRPMTRLIVFRLGADRLERADRYVCTLVTHHVYVDEQSVSLLWTEIFRRVAGLPTSDGYDQRYASWTEAQMSDAGLAEARAAASAIVKRFSGRELAVLGRRQPGAPPPTYGPPLRFPLREALVSAVAERARGLGTGISTIFSAALAHAFTPWAAGRPFALSMSMTLRQVTDADVVGSYTATVPVLADPRRWDSAPAAAIRSWQEAIDFSRARAHADVHLLQSQLGNTNYLSLAIETPSRGRAGHLQWRTLHPPDSPAKSEVFLFVSTGGAPETGHGRLVWRHGALDSVEALKLADAYLHSLSALAAPRPAGPEDGVAG